MVKKCAYNHIDKRLGGSPIFCGRSTTTYITVQNTQINHLINLINSNALNKQSINYSEDKGNCEYAKVYACHFHTEKINDLINLSQPTLCAYNFPRDGRFQLCENEANNPLKVDVTNTKIITSLIEKNIIMGSGIDSPPIFNDDGDITVHFGEFTVHACSIHNKEITEEITKRGGTIVEVEEEDRTNSFQSTNIK